MTRGRFTPRQTEVLLQPIKPQRVLEAQGQAHVAGFDVTAHLSRLFGFDGWDKEILSLDLVGERTGQDNKGRDRYWVTYLCRMRLTVYGTDGQVAKIAEDVATGSAQNQPSYGDAHDLACKNAVTYALKRCAKDLGDQFGLSLYNKGSRAALVGRTLTLEKPSDDAGDVDAHVDAITEADEFADAEHPHTDSPIPPPGVADSGSASAPDDGNPDRGLIGNNPTTNDTANVEGSGLPSDRTQLEQQLTAKVKAMGPDERAAFINWRRGEGFPVKFADMTDTDLAACWFKWIGED